MSPSKKVSYLVLVVEKKQQCNNDTFDDETWSELIGRLTRHAEFFNTLTITKTR